MFDLTDLLFLSVVVLAAAALWRAQGVREIALRAAKRHCDEMEVQWLDGSVALRKVGLARNARGRLCLARAYLFEFTSTGDERYFGSVDMVGHQVRTVQLQPHRLQ
ncbi:DUF3301 domain-containing protein [Exilibacterium tricleocarpae]|uniref:DUF3301 domain-containing protein n=1 Tax=Exilibacterium tricleocarpae TaxID=2591008 RepID=A0A545SY62_9GAMM|nr:DUF3301 domain-containing protein [Exilibacterium tricleocarpae]TQV69905.1 DUF3301 domain-containing protein [Exilibacterium tricleocarpae]